MSDYQVTYGFTATVTREDPYWLAEVPDMPGGHAYARTLAQLRDELTDAVILAADLPDDATVAIDFKPDASVPDADRLDEAFKVARERHEIADRQGVMHRHLAEAARKMTGHYSVRDIAGALDITPGRVSQLAGKHTYRSRPASKQPRPSVAGKA